MNLDQDDPAISGISSEYDDFPTSFSQQQGSQKQGYKTQTEHQEVAQQVSSMSQQAKENEGKGYNVVRFV